MPQLSPVDQIKVINSFISTDEAANLAKYIDFLETTRTKDFNHYQDGKRLGFQFGQDIQYGGTPDYKTFLTIDVLKEEDKKEFIKTICKRVVETARESYSELAPLYVSSFWLAKQYPGCVIPLHDDTDGGYNIHFVYSAVLYLNQLESGGEISFAELGYTHRPKIGDLILFPTQTTGNHAVFEIPKERYSIAFWLTRRSEMSVRGLR